MRLAMELVEWMELEMIELNKSAKYQGSIAEIKLFNTLRGEEKSISELARIMNISRQAVHKTVHKLEDLSANYLAEGDKYYKESNGEKEETNYETYRINSFMDEYLSIQ